MNGRVVAGRYELSALVGQGGMGQVWTAHDRRLDRRVAVKLLRPDRVAEAGDGGDGGRELRRRFARECRITARVEHPGLVTVHDAGDDGDDLYLVMQYVQGADLADHLAENDPYPWPWAVAVAAQLCPVLTAVHAVPVVHRDLKPRNLIVRPDGTLVLLDLGVAAVLNSDTTRLTLNSDTTRLTLTGSPIGSPAYMAPEQAMGGDVGPAADLYALGVVLHELLSGTVPFAGSSALGVLHRHLNEPPVPLRQVRPEVPEPLENLVLRLLAKDPRQRPADAAEVYRFLVPLLPAPGAGPSTGPAGSMGQLGPMDPSRPFRYPSAPWEGSRPALPAAAPPRPAAGKPSVGKEDILAAVDRIRGLLDAGRITQAVGVLADAVPAAAEVHGRDSTVVRMLRKQYAATLMEVGQYRTAHPELRLLAEEREAEFGVTDRQAIGYRFEVAQCLEHLGETAAALAEYRALLPYPDLAPEVRRRISGLRHPQG